MIYLDHTATMVPKKELLEYYLEMAVDFSANPASMHSAGYAARKTQAAAINEMAQIFDCRAEEILITSGGTESINTALKGTLSANKRLGKRVLISSGEHAAVSASASWLSSQGWQIEEIGLNSDGTIDMEQLTAALKTPCALISLIYVNNETGAVNPVEEIVKLKNQLQPQCLIHLDGVQATGKINWSFKKLGIDFFSGSGHKFGTPRGIGWLIHRHGLRIDPLIHGGGQQKGLRSGTENVPLVLTMNRAVQEAWLDLAAKQKYVTGLKSIFLDHMKELGVSYSLLSPSDAVPNIISLAVHGLRGETLLHALENQEIFVSTGSACSSRKREESAVLRAMKFSSELIDGSIRISIAASNTEQEMLDTANAIAAAAKWLAKK